MRREKKIVRRAATRQLTSKKLSRTKALALAVLQQCRFSLSGKQIPRVTMINTNPTPAAVKFSAAAAPPNDDKSLLDPGLLLISDGEHLQKSRNNCSNNGNRSSHNNRHVIRGCAVLSFIAMSVFVPTASSRTGDSKCSVMNDTKRGTILQNTAISDSAPCVGCNLMVATTDKASDTQSMTTNIASRTPIQMLLFGIL